MDSYVPGLFDRLMGDGGASAGGVAVRLSLEQLKDAVARDLEELLNTRVALPPGALDAYPECAASIVNYGLIDFAGMCLSSSDDRARICAALKAAIERHEPRLRNVRARLSAKRVPSTGSASSSAAPWPSRPAAKRSISTPCCSHRRCAIRSTAREPPHEQ